MVQIFVNNIPIISSQENESKEQEKKIMKKNVLETIEAIEAGRIKSAIKVELDDKKLLDYVLLNTKLIEAAGGIVFEPGRRFLLFFRRGWWDLPKGKIDSGERPEEAALREVWEECGLENLKIELSLPSSYHVYREKGKLILKKTYWYVMTIPEIQIPVLQADEDIVDSVWISLEEMKKYKNKTYPNILKVIESVFEK